ncbi:MAG: hypothetical protein KKC18_12870 [Chloroflexi bacterium]|nr:hypothetical protein [Chloroflexota bacterium]
MTTIFLHLIVGLVSPPRRRTPPIGEMALSRASPPPIRSMELTSSAGYAPLRRVEACGGLSWIAEASISEEPGAGKPHAGICVGAVG